MQLKLLTDSNVAQKTVLLRVDYNVPLKKIKNKIVVTDDARLRDTLPTLKYLLDRKCKIVIITHAGRPDGKVVKKLRLDPIANHLQKLLKHPIKKLDQLTGPKVEQAVAQMEAGEIIMLENARFHPGEISKNKTLSKKLASLGEIYVNDSFPVDHRDHASISGIADHLPTVAGFALAKEVEMLSKLTTNPKRPFVAIVGGAKISDKVEAIRNLSKIADVVLIGGGVANNFIKAEGLEIYHSYVEDKTRVDSQKKKKSFVTVAEELLEETKNEKLLLKGYIPLPKIIYPSDVVAAKKMHQPKSTRVIDLTSADNGHVDKETMFLDIGPRTQKLYQQIISEAGTIFWNGPMGVFEEPEFEQGTRAVATAMAKSKATTIVGGGDTISALHKFKMADRYDYVSAAGGASLEFLAGKELPVLKHMIK